MSIEWQSGGWGPLWILTSNSHTGSPSRGRTNVVVEICELTCKSRLESWREWRKHRATVYCQSLGLLGYRLEQLYIKLIFQSSILTTCPCVELPAHLLFQDCQGSLQGVGRAVLGSPGQALCVVTHLGLQRVDLANQLLRFHDVLRLVGQRFRGGAGRASVACLEVAHRWRDNLMRRTTTNDKKTDTQKVFQVSSTLTFPPGKLWLNTSMRRWMNLWAIAVY